MKKISEILRNTREDKDLTQTQVMKDTGINNKTLSGYENGVSEPDIETMVLLFKYYNLSADKEFGLEQRDGSREIKLTSQEENVISAYRLLDKQHKYDIIKIINAIK